MSGGLVIVGGSYAAAQIAASARQGGWQDPITILSEEADAPYQRPPLSKRYLTEDLAETTLALRSPAFYRDNAIALELGVRVASIDRSRKLAIAETGAIWPYERLALATGARPRELPVEGARLGGVVMLRTLADARSLKGSLATTQSVVVIGGGFIGLEAAASCASLGKRVTVVEAQPRLMGRALLPGMAQWFADLHRRNGVRLALGATVKAIQGDQGKVKSVLLGSGEVLEADVVLVGIGVQPNEELARDAGLECADGIVVDRFARTSDPAIVAAGDCTRHPSPWADAPVRLESVQNAQDQARIAAATLTGKELPYDAVPWFWSDQYDAKLQMAGLCAAQDEEVVRGSQEEGKFSVYYLRAGRLVAVHSINRPADHMLARKLIAARVEPDVERLADPGFDLKTLLPA